MGHTPKQLTVSSFSLWGDTPFHPHIRMAIVVDHSPMNGMDRSHTANEIAKRYNCHDDLVEALRMVRDADNDCHKDGLRTIPDIARWKIDAALEKAGAI